VLAPTRELVNQIGESLRTLTGATRLKVNTVVGGQSIGRQINTLARGTDILIATPGRLIDLMDRGAVDLGSVRHLVLDEADQMLDLGFIHALRRIAPRLGTPRRTMLFSATMPKQMEELSRAYLTDPKRVQVSPPGKAADKITQSVHFLEKASKPGKLREILSQDLNALTLVFARTKHGAEKLMKGLVADGFNAASIHGNKSQGQRDRAIKAFRDGSITVLVATDVAARGIDIPGVAYVINYDLPEVPDNYVHRIGRTARAGREGEAVAFCAPEEAGLLRQIQKLMKIEIPVASGPLPNRHGMRRDHMFYRPEDGHGLAAQPVQRHRDAAAHRVDLDPGRGRVGNLAPYSFFNAVAYVPPQVMFASTSAKGDRGDTKDSVANIRETGVFCVNIVEYAMKDVMNQTSGPWPKEPTSSNWPGSNGRPARRSPVRAWWSRQRTSNAG
jgi:ATP-dependent RNA helicase RhlE